MAEFVSVNDAFRKELDDYLKATGMNPTDLGKIVMKNPAFISRFRRGADTTLTSCDKIRRYMHDNPPSTAVGPSKAREKAS